MSCWRFAAMIATSTLVMFGLMYLNTYLWSHLFFSETRAYMAILMGASMAIVMLAFMLSMYSRKTVNSAIFIGAGLGAQDGEPQEANLLLELDAGLKAGFRGFYACRG